MASRRADQPAGDGWRFPDRGVDRRDGPLRTRTRLGQWFSARRHLLRQLRAPRGLEAILDGESLFNDGTGVAVFSAVLGTILSGHPSVTDAGLRFLYVTAAGVAIGLAAGAVAVVVLRLVGEAELEILITLVLAYGSYLAADVVHASGVVAVVASGIVVARHGSRTGRLQGTQLHGFWSLLAF
ncbi:MAG: hypothetical protein E6I92_02460, partial [Chloroflexi bacterium]